MKILHWLGAPLLCALLAACGGGGSGEAGTPPFGSSASSPTSATTKLVFAGPTTVGSGASATLFVKALDATTGAPLSALSVSVSSLLGNGLSPTSVTTDATGTGTVTFTATKLGSDTVTFSGGGATVTAQIVVN